MVHFYSDEYILEQWFSTFSRWSPTEYNTFGTKKNFIAKVLSTQKKVTATKKRVTTNELRNNVLGGLKGYNTKVRNAFY